MSVSRTIVLTLVLTCLCACASKSYQDQRGPKCLGPVCMIWGESIWKDAEPFFEKYGVGFADEGKFPAYWYVENGVYVYIGRHHGENKPIETIVISKHPYYSKHAFPPTQSFGPLATEKGIELGISYNETVAAYGQPDVIYTDSAILKSEVPDNWPVSLKDIKIVRYENAFEEYDHDPWSLFFFENDVLIAIELSTTL